MTRYARPDPLDEAAFLIRSENRIVVLRRLRVGSCARHELKDVLEVSRVTIGQILSDLEDRQWIRRDDQTYKLTPLGEMLIADFEKFLQTVKITHQLQDFIQYLPTEFLPSNLRPLGNADCIRGTHGDSDAPIQRISEVVQEADELSVLTNTLFEQGLSATEKRSTGNRNPAEIVISPIVIEAICNHEQSCLEAKRLIKNGGKIYSYPKEIPHIIIITDKTVLYIVSGEFGTFIALFEINDEKFVSWATVTFEQYKNEAELLGTSVFAE